MLRCFKRLPPCLLPAVNWSALEGNFFSWGRRTESTCLGRGVSGAKGGVAGRGGGEMAGKDPAARPPGNC